MIDLLIQILNFEHIHESFVTLFELFSCFSSLLSLHLNIPLPLYCTSYNVHVHVHTMLLIVDSTFVHATLPRHPQAFGEDMDVPFIIWLFCSVQLGTEVKAPPGAVILTPRSPSVLQE